MIGALVVAALVALALFVQSDSDSPAESARTATTSTPKKPPQTKGWAWVLENFESEYKRKPPKTDVEFLAALRRLRRIGEPAEAVLRRVTRDYVEGPGHDDVRARRYLGDLRFDKTVPEAIAFREYPYIRAVEAAEAKQWYRPSEKPLYEEALAAWDRVLEHSDRLTHDPRFRVADRVRANVARDPFFRDYKFAVRWADPYLIFYASKHRLSAYDMLSLPTEAARTKARAEIEQRKRTFEPILDEKAAIFTGVYKEFMKRYAERLKLKPLMDPWGGRPDYKQGVRRFNDGRPLVVWIFSDHEAFIEYHAKVTRVEISPFVGGYFSPATGWVYLYDEKKNRQSEINKNAHEAIHQLIYWFTRQRGDWHNPTTGQTFFEEGFAEWFGAVRLSPDGRLGFGGVNPSRLLSLQARAARLAKANRKYPVFPLERLTTFRSYGDVIDWSRKHLKLPATEALGLYYEQAWALVYFLDHARGAQRRDQLVSFLDNYLTDDVKFSGIGDIDTFRAEYDRRGKGFRKALGLKTKKDWAELNAQFGEFLLRDLMTREIKPLLYDPPLRVGVR